MGLERFQFSTFTHVYKWKESTSEYHCTFMMMFLMMDLDLDKYTSQFKPINGYKRDGTGRAHQLFLYRSPLLLKSSMFMKIVLGGHYNHV